MPTTLQQVQNRAVQRNVLNSHTTLIADTPDIIHRINTFEQDIFTALAEINRYFYQTSQVATSNAAALNREVNLAAAPFLVSPVERVLKIVLADGRELSQVDLQDLNAELRPRYYPSGQRIIEVSNDWNTTAATAVTMTVYYFSRPPDLNVAGTLTQLVVIPDRYADLLDNRLARFFVTKDAGRDVSEIASLDAEYNERLAQFASYLEHFAGTESRRFNIPRPASRA